MYHMYYQSVSIIIQRAAHSVGTQIELTSYTTYWSKIDTYNT